MTKAEIVRKISKETGIEYGTVLAVVESTMTGIKNALGRSEEVTLRGFGTFLNRTRKAKKARNISKNVTIDVPEHKVPAFKPSEEFKNIVK